MSRACVAGISLLIVVATDPARAQSAPTRVTEAIYDLQSVRTSRLAPTEVPCSGFVMPPATYLPRFIEDVYDIYTYRTRASDGRVVQTTTNLVGFSRACFGVISGTAAGDFRLGWASHYDFGDVRATVTGYCDGRANTPVPGSTIIECYGSAAGEGFVGGTVLGAGAGSPNPIPDEFDPNEFGLHETSFLTMRLWRLPK
jgi:hypothetical protein